MFKLGPPEPIPTMEPPEEPVFDYSSPLAFLTSVYKSEDVPLHTRLRAAAEAAKYSHSTMKARGAMGIRG
jgi:hypothetical protein